MSKSNPKRGSNPAKGKLRKVPHLLTAWAGRHHRVRPHLPRTAAALKRTYCSSDHYTILSIETALH